MFFKGLTLVLLLLWTNMAQGWMFGRLRGGDEKETEYTCFPWIFNPGCPLTHLINWDVVCQTNTLGWEMCDYKKETEEKKSVEAGEKEDEDEKNIFNAEDVIIINNVQLNDNKSNHSPLPPESVLHELANIENERDTYSIIGQSFQPGDDTQIIQLQDIILSESSTSPNKIVQELTKAINASLEDISEDFNAEIQFKPSLVQLPENEPIDESLEKLVNEVFDDEEEEFEVNTPEIFKIENLKPLTYKVKPSLSHKSYNVIESSTVEQPPEIIPLRPFRHIVKVIKHKPEEVTTQSNVVEEEQSTLLLQEIVENEDDIIDPRLSQLF